MGKREQVTSLSLFWYYEKPPCSRYDERVEARYDVKIKLGKNGYANISKEC